VSTSGRSAVLPADFDDEAFALDLERYPDGSLARRVAEAARAEFERDGVSLESVRTCAAEGRDGPRLAGALKVYLRQDQRFGMVLEPERRERELRLVFLAFGVRHQPPGSHAPTVYELAHRRRHGRFP
jgi:hypothetical protein